MLYTLSKVIFYEKLSSVKARLLSGVIFRQRSSSVKGHLPLLGHFNFCPALCAFQQCACCFLSKVIFRQRSSSVKSRLLSKVFFCQKMSSVKGRLPSRLSSSFGSFSFLGFSPECGIAKLSLSLFVSSS